MTYTQAMLALGSAPPLPPALPRAYTAHHPARPAISKQTLTPAGRLPDDLWDEYRFECATRDRLRLPAVGLAEFRDMRDWADQIEEHEEDDDDNRITEPDTDAPPYGCIRRS